MIAFVGSEEGRVEQDRALFESMVEAKDHLFMVRYTYGLTQVAKKIVQDACPVPSKCVKISFLSMFFCAWQVFNDKFS